MTGALILVTAQTENCVHVKNNEKVSSLLKEGCKKGSVRLVLKFADYLLEYQLLDAVINTKTTPFVWGTGEN
jgi:hypothetical protein